MSNSINYILLTGQSGVGKTTLIRKICENLIHMHQIKCNGFITEEVRDANNQRIGFDVVCLNNNVRGTLARTNEAADHVRRVMIGKYKVYVQEFEDTVLPLFNQSSIEQDLFVIDEIGKMELTSQKFCSLIKGCLEQTKLILGTIPYKCQTSLTLVEELRSSAKTKLIFVTKANRNELLPEIVDTILSTLKCSN